MEHTNIKPYKLVNTIQEFEELFGNVPIKDIDKIKKYILENYIPKSKVKERIEGLKISGGSNGRDETENLIRGILIEVLEELLRRRGEIRCVSIFFHTMLLRTELIV